jgi:peptide-methionine (R)-S-oxide reductase
MADKVEKTDEEWRQELTEEKYWDHKQKGNYRCAGCATELFTSETKYDSDCGWPSFTAAATEDGIDEVVDSSHGMSRTEVLCSACGGHLGHVFDDGPAPAGIRYCINSASIDFDAEEGT